MASSSSSTTGNVGGKRLSVVDHLGQRRKAEESVKVFDVFINHRGPDVKETLARELYESLKKLGIHAYLDSEEKELGIAIDSTIETAIWSAKVHIAIFSIGYADSAWCLAELVLMLQTEATIIPVFYEVQPCELRYIEKGVYDQSFKQYTEKSRYTDKLEEWKQALNRISHVTGCEIKKSNFIKGGRECREIVSAVQREMQKIKVKLHVAKYPVGLPMLVEDFERKCNIDGGGHGKALVVGICGMGGAGKTTLSKELFNKYSTKFTRASFLFDVREATNKGDLYSLQQKLFIDLFAEEPPSFRSKDEGISILQDRLKRIPTVNFLIVLDDIDHLKQLDNLLVADMVKKSGDSLIIISTRNAGVLRGAGILTYYELQGLDREEAKELFCFHAFDQRTPESGYDFLVDKFVEGCVRLPLSLQILGSHVKGKKQEYWSSALKKVQKVLHNDIKATLQISIDSLDSEEKEIFLDIACFFIGCCKNLAKRVWKASGWEAHQALETLKEKFIVQEIKTKRLDGRKWEWDGIDLGMHDHLRDLGREMASQETSRRRFWQPQDLKSLESKGEFSNIINKIKGRCFHSVFDTSTCSQVTYFLDESASLLWLQLDLIPDERPSLPSWIPLQKLQCLRISQGHLKTLWQSDLQEPLQLKELQISETLLKEVPDLGRLDNLENVVLDAKYMAKKGWSLLESLRMSIIALRFMSSTLEGKLACTSSEELMIPNYLIIRNFDLSEEIVLKGSPMNRVENLELDNQNLVTNISIRGKDCPHLESLKLRHVENLIEIDLVRVETLNSLDMNHCKKLKRVSKISDLTKLVELNISECPELESELCLRSLACLERVTVDRCRKLKHLELIDCEMFVELNISECPELSELCLGGLYRLETIIVLRCRKLKFLELIDCKNLERVLGMEDLKELAILNIKDCPELRQLPARNLSCRERMTIDGCEKLNCHAFYSLPSLKIVTFDIGRAVEGAESILNPDLFSEVIGAGTVTEMDIPCTAIPEASVSKIIICSLVVVERSTPLYINSRSQELPLRKGRWIVTMVIADPEGNTSFISAAVAGMCYGMVNRGYRVTLMKHQEGETRNVLETIDNKLYYK